MKGGEFHNFFSCRIWKSVVVSRGVGKVWDGMRCSKKVEVA